MKSRFTHGLRAKSRVAGAGIYRSPVNGAPPASKPERGAEDRSLHVDVVAEIAAARRDIETAVAEAQCDPRLQGIVERADDLPIDMRSAPNRPNRPKQPSRRRPGPTSAMDTGLCRYDKKGGALDRASSPPVLGHYWQGRPSA
jgi:hypothetical protein